MQRLRVSGFAGLIALSGLWVAAGGCTTVTVEKPAAAPKVEERAASAQAPDAKEDEEQQAQRSGDADKALDAWCAIPREQRALPRIQAEARASFSLGVGECIDQGFEPCSFSFFAAGSSVAASQQQQQQQRGLDKGVAAQRTQKGREAQRSIVSSFSDVRCRVEFESGGGACCACGVQ